MQAGGEIAAQLREALSFRASTPAAMAQLEVAELGHAGCCLKMGRVSSCRVLKAGLRAQEASWRHRSGTQRQLMSVRAEWCYSCAGILAQWSAIGGQSRRLPSLSLRSARTQRLFSQPSERMPGKPCQTAAAALSMLLPSLLRPALPFLWPFPLPFCPFFAFALLLLSPSDLPARCCSAFAFSRAKGGGKSGVHGHSNSMASRLYITG